jgi:hypothetical protein
MNRVARLPLIAGAVAVGVLTAGCSSAHPWHNVATADSHVVGHVVVQPSRMIRACRAFRDQVIPNAGIVGMVGFSTTTSTLLPLLGHRRVNWDVRSNKDPALRCDYEAYTAGELRGLNVQQYKSENTFVASAIIDRRGGWIPVVVDHNGDD